MENYFNYTKKQRTVAYTILANACLLFFMYLALVEYLPIAGSEKAATEILNVVQIAIWPIEFILCALAAYFWLKNKSFQLRVTPTELYYFDPTFSDVEHRVPVKDIKELVQYTNTQESGFTNKVILKSGEAIQLMYGNFHIDRQAFFDALLKANADIKVPESPYRYTKTRPAWAKKLLKKD